ncbi:MAG TPA: 6-carboxytetrahydropterin synthase, partial [Ktedonobacterales bacterium]|nr:6-carboxytetrahydropterin synthase [Ktedonobacterales bacterium]
LKAPTLRVGNRGRKTPARAMGREQEATGHSGVVMSWKIVIDGGNLGFAAAHFITFEGRCEPLHGHNYGVSLELAGALTRDSYVFDFVALKDIMRAICKEWDHCFLLPLQNPHLRLVETAREWEIIYTGSFDAQPIASNAPALPAPPANSREPLRYVLPRETVVTLPVDNATAERLAEQLARRIVGQLRQRLAPTPAAFDALTTLTVGVAETEMQTAFYTLDLCNLEHSAS